MSLSTLVHDALSGNTGVSTLTSTRIYPLLLPQHPTYPAISYQRISNTGQMGSTALRTTRYQINGWTNTYSGAQALATVIKAALEEYTDTNQTPAIKMSLVVNELDDYDPEAQVYRTIVDVIFITSGD